VHTNVAHKVSVGHMKQGAPLQGLRFRGFDVLWQEFRKPQFVPHTCPVEEVDFDILQQKAFTGKRIARMESVRALVIKSGRGITPKAIQNHLASLGNSIEYSNCVNACKYLVADLFGDDAKQYGLLLSYFAELKKRGHQVLPVFKHDMFRRGAVVYKEGIQSFAMYYKRGLSSDGTFLKNTVGDMLLIACFLNGNNEIQIVSAAFVANENHENWSWFVQHLLAHLRICPLLQLLSPQTVTRDCLAQ
jgi:MULE transposase domain